MLPTVPISPSLSTHADDFVALQPPFDSSQSESTSPSTITVVTEDSVLEDSSSEIAPTTLRQHPEFFLRDPHVTLTVENTIFRVHSFFFERESDEARSVLLQTADDGSVVIYGIEAVDLERFLKVLYCNVAGEPGLSTKDEWTSVLELAHRWNFASIRGLAIRKLLPITSAVDQIVLSAKYAIGAWKMNAYLQICEQDAWPSPDDCRRLGVEELIKIGQAWRALRSPTIVVPADDREVVVGSIFNLLCEDGPDVLLHRETESEMHRRLTTDAKNKELQHLLSAKEDARRAANSEAERAERERDEAEDEYKQLRKVLKKRRHAEYRRLEAERRGLEEEQQELRLRVQANEAKAAVLALKVNHEQTGPSATQATATLTESVPKPNVVPNGEGSLEGSAATVEKSPTPGADSAARAARARRFGLL